MQHRRKVLRAREYDYSTPGNYFVTICTQDRALVFGEARDGQMILNQCGMLATRVWESLPTRFPSISLDAFVLMPNHLHAIVGIAVDPDVAAQFIAPFPRRGQDCEETSSNRGGKKGAINRAATSELPSLGTVIRVFKAVTSDQIRRTGLSTFRWQANYRDRIVRNERELERIRAYIEANPGNWHRDQDNPEISHRGDALRRPV